MTITGLLTTMLSNTPNAKALNAAAIGYYPISNAVSFGNWLGRPVQYGMGYTSRSNWAGTENDTALLNSAQSWKAGDPTHRRFIISIPMVPNDGSTIATCATGAYNFHFTTLGNNLVSRGLQNTVIRLAWEMNGSWFPGGYTGNTPASWNTWKNCWIQIVNTMRAVSGNQFIYDFNPNIGYSESGTFFSAYYPGDAYVDVIALDVYDFHYGVCGSSFAARWNNLLTQPGGLNDFAAFADAHGKPMAFDEWGLWGTAPQHCGGGDDPQFIDAMADWFENHNVAWHSYFDVSADSDHRLNSYPNSKARYLARFGPIPPTNTPAGPTPTRTNTPIPGTSTNTPVPGTIRIEAGSTASFTDSGGNVWAADHSFVAGSGGTADRGAIAIANTVDDKIYQTERWGATAYNITIPNGTYTVKLHFAETSPAITGAGQRIFNVNVEGQVLNGLDVFAQAGGKNIALIKTFNNVVVTDGMVNIAMTASVQATEINGVEIVPAVVGPTPTPTNTPTSTPVPPTNTPTNTPLPGGAYNDEFNSGTLAGIWSWVRQDSANWSLSAVPGSMRITCQAGEINNANTTAKNILIETAPTGDWTAIVKVTGKPTANWAQVAILAYQDDNNWVKVDRVFDSGNKFQVGREAAGAYTFTNVTDSIVSTTSYLRLVKSGTSYTAFYSADGNTFTQIGAAQTITLSNIKIGLSCYGGTGISGDFDWIHITQP